MVAERTPLVDTHAHLMDPSFASDLDQVLERAERAGLVAIVCVGYDLESSRAAVELAERYPRIWATVGVHPNYAGAADERDFAQVSRLARHSRVVGIGETGLDYFRQYTPPSVQRAWFHRHLELAGELGLPVVVHCREANEDVGDLLVRWAASLAGRERPPGVLHCFAGDERLGSRCLDVGFLLSFAGPLTFKREGALAEAARRAPLDRVVVETDSPYLAPVPRRGQRNEPALVRYTLERLAELRDAEVAEMGRRTSHNACRLFGLPSCNDARGGA